MSRSFRQSALALSASIAAAAVVASFTATAGLALASPDAAPQIGDAPGEIQNSRFQFEGEVNANAVYVRSGPSENDYATAKLDKGSKVVVVGAGKFDWLKIMPPEGSFCYVAKAYVEKRGSGKVGRVTNALNVRVGSQLLPMKTKVAAKLEPGQDVEIVGEQDEYFKIKPPATVYLYINKQFVEPVRRVEVPGLPTDGDATGKAVPSPMPPTATHDRTPADPAPSADTIAASTPRGTSTDQGVEQPASEGGGAAAEPPARDSTAVAGVPATQPTASPTLALTDDAANPTTQPTGVTATIAAELEFDRLEARLREVSNQPIQQQPIPELLAGYQKLAASDVLPESMRRMAEYRVGTLKVHNDNREMILAHERDRQDREQALVALKREADELTERMKSTGIVFYAAVGTLRPSSLQTGGEGTLYRLTDPVTGRTLVYIRSTDPRMVSMMGLFVGVQGEVIDDQQWKLKVITPTDIEPIDQKKVNRSIAAKIIPPSLMPGGALNEANGGQ